MSHYQRKINKPKTLALPTRTCITQSMPIDWTEHEVKSLTLQELPTFAEGLKHSNSSWILILFWGVNPWVMLREGKSHHSHPHYNSYLISLTPMHYKIGLVQYTSVLSECTTQLSRCNPIRLHILLLFILSLNVSKILGCAYAQASTSSPNNWREHDLKVMLKGPW